MGCPLHAKTVAMKTKYAVFALMSMVLAGVLGCIEEAFAATEVVTCFGDSITAGWYVYAKDGNGCKPPCGGYEPALQQSLLAAGHDVVLRNYGIGGETTGEGLSRIDSVLTASNPKYVLLLEGTNDALLSSPGTIVANLSSMIDRVLARNATPILATLTPDNRNNGFKPIEEINSRIKTLAAEKNIAVVDLYAATTGSWNSLNSDGLHPNAAGYKLIAQTWYSQFPALGGYKPWLHLLLN